MAARIPPRCRGTLTESPGGGTDGRTDPMTDARAPRSRTATLSLYLTIGTLLAGTVPFLSFYVEHQRTKQVKADFGV